MYKFKSLHYPEPVVNAAGRDVKFSNYEFTTDDKEIAEALKKNRNIMCVEEPKEKAAPKKTNGAKKSKPKE